MTRRKKNQIFLQKLLTKNTVLFENCSPRAIAGLWSRGGCEVNCVVIVTHETERCRVGASARHRSLWVRNAAAEGSHISAFESTALGESAFTGRWLVGARRAHGETMLRARPSSKWRRLQNKKQKQPSGQIAKLFAFLNTFRSSKIRA